MKKLLLAFLWVLIAPTLSNTIAQAQNARSWVAGNGSGTACTRAAPCATFQAAYNVTNSGGAIHCVDAGEFSNNGVGLVISKSITIDCAGTLGAHGKAVFRIEGPGIVVHLRNLLIDAGTNNPDQIGVLFINGAALYIDHCTISGWNVGQAHGIDFEVPSGVAAKLVVIDSTIVDNGISGTAGTGGIYIRPAGTGTARVSITGTKIVGNSYGIYADGTGGSAGGFTSILIKDSFIANSTSNGVTLISEPGFANVSLTMDHSASVGNGVDGIWAQGGNSFAILTESTIVANLNMGLHPISGGKIISMQNNAIVGNVSDVNPTASIALK